MKEQKSLIKYGITLSNRRIIQTEPQGATKLGLALNEEKDGCFS